MTSDPFHQKSFSKSADYSEIETILKQSFDPAYNWRTVSFFDKTLYGDAAKGIMVLRKESVDVKTPKGKLIIESIPPLNALLIKQDKNNIFAVYEGKRLDEEKIVSLLGNKHSKTFNPITAVATAAIFGTGTYFLGEELFPLLNAVMDIEMDIAQTAVGALLGIGGYKVANEVSNSIKWNNAKKGLLSLTKEQIYFQNSAVKHVNKLISEGFEQYRQDLAIENMQAIYEGNDFDDLSDSFVTGGLENLTVTAIEKELKPRTIKALRQAAQPELQETKEEYFRQIRF